MKMKEVVACASLRIYVLFSEAAEVAKKAKTILETMLQMYQASWEPVGLGALLLPEDHDAVITALQNSRDKARAP